MKLNKVHITFLIIVNLLVGCDWNIFDSKEDYTGDWEFTIKSYNHTRFGDSPVVTTTYTGVINPGKTNNELIINYSDRCFIVVTRESNEEFSWYANIRCNANGKFTSPNSLKFSLICGTNDHTS